MTRQPAIRQLSKVHCLFVAIAFGFTASSAFAQSPTSFPVPVQSPPVSYHHASTWDEGRLRGQADLRRAIGEFNYNTAAAAYINEQTRAVQLQNKLTHAEVFWGKRRLHDEFVASQVVVRGKRGK